MKQTPWAAFTKTPTFIGGLFALGLGVGVGLALVLGVTRLSVPQTVVATHDNPGTIHACVSRFTKQARIMFPGESPACNRNEFLVELGSADTMTDLHGRFDALESEIDALAAQVPDCLAEESGDAVFTGCDVEIRNGLGETDSTNGTGNLIVGYNENLPAYNRDGSHNIVVGEDLGYSAYGGLVAGRGNVISGNYASVSGGQFNEASGDYSSVSGGEFNKASGTSSSASGGYSNEASGDLSSVSGGFDSAASGGASSVSGGFSSWASGANAAVSGGYNNTASGDTSSVSGGYFNEASGSHSSVSGGRERTASDIDDWAAGSLLEDS